MATKQPYSRFQYHMTGYLVHWSQKPPLWGLNSAVLLVVMLLTLTGFLFFFVPEFNLAVTGYSGESSEASFIGVQPSRYSDNFIEANHSNNQTVTK